MLNGRVAIVTGAARGIGRGIAEALADIASEERGGQAAYAAFIKQSTPLGRAQTPEDIAAAVLYLATAPNVTGVSLIVAGGMEMA